MSKPNQQADGLNQQLNKSLLSEEGKPSNEGDKNQENKKQGALQCVEKIFQLQQYGGRKITNKILKMFFLLFLYMSYAILAAAAFLIVVNGQDLKDKFIDYVNQQATLNLIIAFIIVGIMTLVTYQFFLKNKELTPQSRKILNFVLDIMTVAFHSIFLVFVKGFVYQSNNNKLLIAFWLVLLALIFFVVRSVLKWVDFFFGQSKDKLDVWDKPFQYDRQMMKKHMEMLDTIKGDVGKLLVLGAKNASLPNQVKDEENLPLNR